MNDQNATGRRWYEGVTPYMWLVLLVASLGWVFDIFEGQIFVASMKEAMPSLLPKGTLEGTVDFYNNIAMGAYLVGGAVGGVLFGMLSDKIGRTRTMILTILMYSLFTCVTALAQTWWQMTVLRFLVAMGTGGEWAVASAMVAEVFPKRARAWSLGIFHASSVLGTYLAVLAGVLVVGNPNFGWRWGFVLGALPALLTLWIRWKLREPEQWEQARDRAKADTAQRTGRILDLFGPGLVRNTLVGLILATIGLATFWGVHIYGRELLRSMVERPYLAEAEPQIEKAVDAMRGRTEAILAAHSEAIEPTRYKPVVDESAAEIGDALETILQPYYEDEKQGNMENARRQVRETLEEILRESSNAKEQEKLRSLLEETENRGAEVAVAELRDYFDTLKRQRLAENVKKALEEVLKPLRATAQEQRGPIERERVAQAPDKLRKRMEQAILTALPDAHKEIIKGWEMLGMFLVTTGGGLGLLSFGPICERIGRRGTFLLFHLGGLASALVVFQGMADASAAALCWMLPVFGFLTLGMHAGYAIYFPELFPTRLRGTGGGFCFNGGRFLAASILLVRGWMRDDQGLGLSLESTASILSLLFLLGVLVLLAAPETKGRDLPT